MHLHISHLAIALVAKEVSFKYIPDEGITLLDGHKAPFESIQIDAYGFAILYDQFGQEVSTDTMIEWFLN